MRVAQMPRYRDLAIFVPMTDNDRRWQTTDDSKRQTKPIALPLAHVRGVIKGVQCMGQCTCILSSSSIYNLNAVDQEFSSVNRNYSLIIPYKCIQKEGSRSKKIKYSNMKYSWSTVVHACACTELAGIIVQTIENSLKVYKQACPSFSTHEVMCASRTMHGISINVFISGVRDHVSHNIITSNIILLASWPWPCRWLQTKGP